MKVSVIQFERNEKYDVDVNIAQMEEQIDLCKESNLIVLPEMWATGYYCFERYHHIEENNKIIDFLCRKAKEIGAYIAGGTIIEKIEDQYYNSLPFISPEGKCIATYRKRNLVTFNSEEVKLIQNGKESTVVDTPFGRIGFAICYDVRFPKNFIEMTEKNVDIIVLSAAWSFPRLEHWCLLSQCRAIENVSYLIACNCVGTERGNVYFGHSAIYDPWGTKIAAAGIEKTIVSAEINPEHVQEIRKKFPVLRDRLQ